MTIVVSNCSKRKRASLDPTLRAGDLAAGSSDFVAAAWSQRLRTAHLVSQVEDLYGGRAFSEARQTAHGLNARFAVVSAGLGLVDGNVAVPAYSLTIAHRDPDGILTKTGSNSSDWWAAVRGCSPFHNASMPDEGLILAALSSTYLAMVADEWAAWPDERLARLRLFTKEEPKGLAEGLRQAWMPYDDRLDAAGGGHAGTQSDFAQRALRHFAITIGDKGTLDHDRAAVQDGLHGLQARQVPVRARHSDDELRTLITNEWDVVSGRSGAMLRHLRDDLGVACEQSRFKRLFGLVINDRTEGVGP